MVCIYQNLRSFIVQSLAGQPVPETADRNAAFIYKTLVAHEWPAPPYKRPGGTIYVPGKALAYYPEGTDWSPNTLSTFYLLDGFVHLLELDKGLAHPAGEWRRLRVKKMLEFQARHPDGHMYAKGEFDSLPIVEQVIPYIAGDIVLLHWLRDQKAISRKENWLKQ
jgi:hypothetical protein